MEAEFKYNVNTRLTTLYVVNLVESNSPVLKMSSIYNIQLHDSKFKECGICQRKLNYGCNNPSVSKYYMNNPANINCQAYKVNA